MAETTQLDPNLAKFTAREEVARSCGLPIDLSDASRPIQTISTEVASTLVPLCSLEAGTLVAVNRKGGDEYLAKSDGKFFVL